MTSSSPLQLDQEYLKFLQKNEPLAIPSHLDLQKLLHHAVYLLLDITDELMQVKGTILPQRVIVEKSTLSSKLTQFVERIKGHTSADTEVMKQFVEHIYTRSQDNNKLFAKMGAKTITNVLSPTQYDYSQLLDRPNMSCGQIYFATEAVYLALVEGPFSETSLMKMVTLLERLVKQEPTNQEASVTVNRLASLIEETTLTHLATIQVGVLQTVIEKMLQLQDKRFALNIASSSLTQLSLLGEEYIHKIVKICIEELRQGTEERNMMSALEVLISVLDLARGANNFRSMILDEMPNFIPLLPPLTKHAAMDVMHLNKLYDVLDTSSSQPETATTKMPLTKLHEENNEEEADLLEDEEDEELEDLDDVVQWNVRKAAASLLDNTSVFEPGATGDLVFHQLLDMFAKGDVNAKEAAVLSMGAIAESLKLTTKENHYLIFNMLLSTINSKSTNEEEDKRLYEMLKSTACWTVGRLSREMLEIQKTDEFLRIICKEINGPCSPKFVEAALTSVCCIFENNPRPKAPDSFGILLETILGCLSKPASLFHKCFIIACDTIATVVKRYPDDLTPSIASTIDQIIDLLSGKVPILCFAEVLSELGTKIQLKASFPKMIDQYLMPELNNAMLNEETLVSVVEAIGSILETLKEESVPYLSESLMKVMLNMIDSTSPEQMMSALGSLYGYRYLLMTRSPPAWLTARVPKIMSTIVNIIEKPQVAISVTHNAYYSFSGLVSALPTATAVNYGEPVLNKIIKTVDFNSTNTIAHNVMQGTIAHLTVAAPQYMASRISEYFNIFYRLSKQQEISAENEQETIKGLINIISLNMTVGYFYCDHSSFENFDTKQALQHEYQGNTVKRRRLMTEPENSAEQVTKAIGLMMSHKMEAVSPNDRYEIGRILAQFKARMPSNCWELFTSEFAEIRTYLRLLPTFSSKPQALGDITILCVR